MKLAEPYAIASAVVKADNSAAVTYLPKNNLVKYKNIPTNGLIGGRNALRS